MCAQSRQTLCDPMDCSLPVSSVHGVFQARILEWVAIPTPGVLPDAGIEPKSPALADVFFSNEPPGKAKNMPQWHIDQFELKVT